MSVVASNVLQLYPPCNSLNYPSARPQKVSIFITVSPNIFHQVLWVAFFVLVRVSQRKQENQNLLSPLLSLSLSISFPSTPSSSSLFIPSSLSSSSSVSPSLPFPPLPYHTHLLLYLLCVLSCCCWDFA